MRTRKNRSGLKRLVAYALILAMLLTLMPTSAFAARKTSPFSWMFQSFTQPKAAPAPAPEPEAPAEEPAPAEPEAPAEEPAPEPEAPAEEPAAEAPAEEPAPEEPAEEPAPEEPAAEAPAEEPAPEEEPVAIAEELEVDDLTVSIEAEAGAFPAGTEVKAEKVDFEDVQKAVDEAEDLAGEVLYAVDITFTKDGEELQPAEGKTVKVSFRADDLKDVAEDATIVHIDAETEKAEKVDTVEAEEEDEVAFEAEKFSVYAVLAEGEPGKLARITVSFYNDFKPDSATSDLITTVYVKNEDCVDGGKWENGEDASAEEKLKLIVYDPGLGTDGLDPTYAEATFVGWEAFSDTEHPSSVTLPTGVKTIEDIREWLINYSTTTGFVEGDTINFRVVLNKIYHVDYYDRPSESRPDIVIGAQTAFAPMNDEAGFDPAEHEVNWPYTVVTSDDSPVIENFQGWKVKDADSLANIDYLVQTEDDVTTHVTVTADTVIKNGETLVIHGDIKLIPYVATGNWLVFEEVRPGAPYNAPQFLEAGESAKLPNAEDMTLLGYKFGGWYTDEACTDGHEYTGGPITVKTTVYAKWTAEDRAAYTIIVWKQNLDPATGEPYYKEADKDKFYSYSESIRLWGASFSTIDSVSIGTDNGAADYLIYSGQNQAGNGTISGDRRVTHTGTNGTHSYQNPEYIGYKCVRYDTGVTINPEGNSIVNVYYDRLQYTVRIYHARRGNNNTNYNAPETRSTTNNQNSNTLALDDMNWTGTLSNYTGITGEQSMQSGNYTYYYTTVTAYYGADISDKWPKYVDYPNVTSGNTTYTLVSWYMQNTAESYRGSGSGLDTIKGLISKMDEQILGDVTSTTVGDNFLIGRYDDRTIYTYNYQIWKEALTDDNGAPIIPKDDAGQAKQSTLGSDGKTYYLDDEIPSRSAVNTPATATTAPSYIGFTTGAIAPGYHTFNANNEMDVDFYYQRVLNKVNYCDGVYVNPDGIPLEKFPAEGEMVSTPENIPFDSDMSSYNKGGADYYDGYEPSYSGFVFECWCIDSTCQVPYTFSTMGEEDITVYAKFRQREYRVFMHPNAGTDPSLNYGTDNPDLSILVTDGQKVPTLNPKRDDYKLIGWFYGEDLKGWWGDDQKATETTVTEAYDYNAAGVYTDTFDKYGDIQSTPAPINEDKDNDAYWVDRQLNLTAKWSWMLVGADGINVVYDAADGNFTVDETATDPNPTLKTYKDPLLYADGSGATAPLAQFAPNAPEGKVFLYWVIQTWEPADPENPQNGEGEYVDTAKKVYPGDSFDVSATDSKVYNTHEQIPDPKNPGQFIDKLEYTMQLRAEYGKGEADTPTHITWYTVNNTAVLSEVYPFSEPYDASLEKFKYIQRFDGELQINKPVVIPDIPDDTTFPTDLMGPKSNYTFLGWAKGHKPTANENAKAGEGEYVMPTEDDLWLEWTGTGNNYKVILDDGSYMQDKNGTDAIVTKVAADELLPYDDLFAIWKKERETFRVVYASDMTLSTGEDDSLIGTLKDGKKMYEFYVDDFSAEAPLDVVYGTSEQKDVDDTNPLRNVYTTRLYGGYRFASLKDGKSIVINDYGRTSAGDASGDKIVPVADMVYYVKDVDPQYLSSYYKYTYINKGKLVTGLWDISILDDLNYASAGFVIWGVSWYLQGNSGDTSQYGEDGEEWYFAETIEKAYKTLTVYSYHHRVDENGDPVIASTVTVTPENVFPGTGAGDGTDPRLFYVAAEDIWSDFEDVIRLEENRSKATFSAIPYWITFDGVNVLAKKYRVVTIHPKKNVCSQYTDVTIDQSSELFTTLLEQVE